MQQKKYTQKKCEAMQNWARRCCQSRGQM